MPRPPNPLPSFLPQGAFIRNLTRWQLIQFNRAAVSEPTPSDSEWDKTLRQAWITTTLERDKAMITLSSAGLALLVTFMTRLTTVHQCMARLILLIGLIAFTTSIIAGVWCLHINRDIIRRELKREAETVSVLPDVILTSGFIAGVCSVSLIGLIAILSP